MGKIRLIPFATWTAVYYSAQSADLLFKGSLRFATGILIYAILAKKIHHLYAYLLGGLLLLITQSNFTTELPLSILGHGAMVLWARLALHHRSLSERSFATTQATLDTMLQVLYLCIIPTVFLTPALAASHATVKQTIGAMFLDWMSSFSGAICIAPALCLMTQRQLRLYIRPSILAYAALLSLAIIFGFYLFLDFKICSFLSAYMPRRNYILFPLFVWGAIQFGPLGVSIISFAISLIASIGVSLHHGIFASPADIETIIHTQTFNVITSATGLILATILNDQRSSESKYRSMFEMSEVPMVETDLDGIFIKVNDCYCKLTGYAREDLLMKHFNSITHPDDIAPNKQAFVDLIQGKTRYLEFEKRYITKSNETKWVVVNSTIISNQYQQDASALGVFMDVTERVKAQHQALEQKARAEQANKAKSDFLAFMSHEIRTPLGAILGFIELLRDPRLSASERIDFLDIVQRNAHLLKLLVDDVLDVAKVESGNVDLLLEAIDLRTLINDVIQTLNPLATAKNLTLSSIETSDIPHSITTDGHRLRQILMNLVGNAIKFTEKGKIVIKSRYLNTDATQPKSIAISVIDSGVGISEENQKLLFLPFQQIFNGKTSNQKGTGLGLVLSKLLAKLLAGDLTLKSSRLNIGSEFELIISDLASQSGRIKSQTKSDPVKTETSSPSTRMGHWSILVVDDTEDQQLLLGALLKSSGCTVDFANNGHEAIGMAINKPYDAILMDMQMPILSGFDATRLLRQKGLQTPIIALTAQARHEDAEKSLESGCSKFLSKPFTREQLIDTLSQAIEMSKT